MQIRNVMTERPDVVAPDLTVDLVARQMKERGVGAIPVCDSDKLLGMITDRDIAVRAVAEGLDPGNTPVRLSMNPTVYFCFEDQEVEEAAQIMREHQVRRLPVLNRERQLIGIVSLGDLAVDADSATAGKALEGVSEPAEPVDPS